MIETVVFWGKVAMAVGILFVAGRRREGEHVFWGNGEEISAGEWAWRQRTGNWHAYQNAAPHQVGCPCGDCPDRFAR